MAPLRKQLTKLFTKYKVDLSGRANLEKEIQQEFIRSFSQPIPTELEARSLDEKQLIQSIRHQLKQDRLILRRTADEKNTYYLGQLDEFNRMANDYVHTANCYEIMAVIDENTSEEQILKKIIKSIDSKLQTLHKDRLIKNDHLDKLSLDKKTNISLPYFYFLPETHQVPLEFLVYF